MFLFNVGFVITRVPNFIVIALQALTHPSRQILGGLLIIDCRVLPPAMVTAQHQDLAGVYRRDCRFALSLATPLDWVNKLSFFLSLVLKTQHNHWTKRMVNTRLAT